MKNEGEESSWQVLENCWLSTQREELATSTTLSFLTLSSLLSLFCWIVEKNFFNFQHVEKSFPLWPKSVRNLKLFIVPFFPQHTSHFAFSSLLSKFRFVRDYTRDGDGSVWSLKLDYIVVQLFIFSSLCRPPLFDKHGVKVEWRKFSIYTETTTTRPPENCRITSWWRIVMNNASLCWCRWN